MTAGAAELLLAELARCGIELQVHGDRLRFRPQAAVTPDLLERLKRHKAELLALMQGHAVGQLARSVQNHSADGGTPYVLVMDRIGLDAVAGALNRAWLVGVDVETTGLDPRADRVRLLQLSLDTVGGGRFIYIIDAIQVDPSPLWEGLAEKMLVIHNAAFDLAFLARLGFRPGGKVYDTMLLAQLLAAGTADRVTLAACCGRYLGISLDKAHQRDDWTGPLTDAQLAYAAADVNVLAPLLTALTDKISAEGLSHAAMTEQRCLPAVLWMAGNGVAVDRDAWQALAHGVDEESGRLCEQLDAIAPPRPGARDGGPAWNWNSQPQVLEALRLAGCRVNDTRDETLAAVDHSLAQLLRRYREKRTLGGTYGAAWLKYVAADGRVYADWHQCGAKTGRMSSGKPNLQNLPRDAAYRGCFAAPVGRVLVKADYSQIELRIAAKVANEQRMIEAYRLGDDLHTLTARQLTGRKEVSKEERQLAKPINFGLIYGLGADSLMRTARWDYGVEMSKAHADRYRRRFFAAWPGIARWHQQLKRQQAGGVTETRTLTGRRMIVKPDYWHGGRANYIVQGTGGDGIKLALALLWERRDQCPGAFPVLAVHDEIVVECDADQADAVVGWQKGAMVDAMAPLIDPVPVGPVAPKVGKTWGVE
jgi:DNA polymerase-1